MGLVSVGHDGGGVSIHGGAGVLIHGRMSEVVASGQTVRALRLKCSALIFENKHSHSPRFGTCSRDKYADYLGYLNI